MILSAKYELMRKNFRNFAETEFTTEIQEQLDRVYDRDPGKTG